jgi:hypothetical protein
MSGTFQITIINPIVLGFSSSVGRPTRGECCGSCTVEILGEK